MKVRTFASLVLSGVVLVALAGCSGSVHPPRPVSTSSPVPTQSPTESPTPVIDLSAPQTWIIGDGTVGPLRLGQSRKDAAAAMTAFTSEPNQCYVDLYKSTSSYMNIVLSPPEPSGTTVDIILIDAGNDPTAPSPRTAEGIGLGSTVAEILAAYPNIQQPNPDRYPTYSLVQPDGTWIDFGVTKDTHKVNNIAVMHSDYPPSEYCG